MARTDVSAAEAANTPKLLAAWLFVGIPLLFGVFDTLRNALKLFQ
jgi:predicted signal transduction protein with EAL and GGDEF domain